MTKFCSTDKFIFASGRCFHVPFHVLFLLRPLKGGEENGQSQVSMVSTHVTAAGAWGPQSGKRPERPPDSTPSYFTGAMETQTEGRGLVPGVRAGAGTGLFKEAGKQGVESEGGL